MIDTLEKEWKQSQPQLTLSQWIDVFPEAKPYLKSKMEKLRLLKENLQQVITEKRLKIENLNTDYFSKWFYLQELFVWWVEDLKKVKKEIKKISWAVSPRLKSKNAIGEYEIAKARAYPIKELLENYGYKVKNNFCLSPFRKEASPSFCIKNGFGYDFGEGKSYDSIGLVMQLESRGFIDAVKQLI